MNIEIGAGKYVIAVSGGVDSVCLLDMLSKMKDVKLAVAHFDHGIRPDSKKDRLFVEGLAGKYGLEFYYAEGKLGAKASEALARKKRYEFLRKIEQATKAKAIVTAHHQDDVLETAVINLIRGTGRKGLSSLSSKPELIRPLLNFSKAELIRYAKTKNLVWREDETNTDQNYLRNYVRHSLLKKLSKQQKDKLLKITQAASLTNSQIDREIGRLFSGQAGIKRAEFAKLPHSVAGEVVAYLLRKNHLRIDIKTVERLAISLKTAPSNSVIQANKNYGFVIKNGVIRLEASRAV